jgi:hypothetical protein
MLELDSKTKPQHQLNRGVSDFLLDYDTPHSLLIVYYTGVACWRDLENYLELRASMNSTATRYATDAHASWNRVEEMLRSEDNEADALMILDACYSSNMAVGDTMSSGVTSRRSEMSSVVASRKFELLCATPIDQTTAAPHQHTFTRALIDTLHEFSHEYRDKRFSTFQLTQRLSLSKQGHHTPVSLWVRTLNDQHIFLAPMGNQKGKSIKRASQHSEGRLTLSFDIRDRVLNEEQIAYLVKSFAKAFEGKAMLGIQNMNWHGITCMKRYDFGSVAAVIFAAVRWKKVVQRRREERAMLE